jgi:RNA polymerase sigma-70 factor (ECF subfamily)
MEVESSEAEHEGDRELVRRLLDGDHLAFEVFWKEHAARVHRFALHRTGGDRELASDAVQAALCTAMGALDSYRGEGSLFSWICGICRYEVLARLRQRGRQGSEVPIEGAVEGDEVLSRLLASPGGPEVELLRAEARSAVHETLDRMPPRYARALEWKYAESWSVREIAASLQVSEKAVESLLVRARRLFRELFEPGGPRRPTT